MALYPPIIASSLPAFDLGQGYIPLSFSLSKYNSISDIHTIQVSIRQHTSNISVIDNNLYNVAFDAKKQYNQKTNLYEFQVEIGKGVTLKADTLYRVQLRFTIQGVQTASLVDYTNDPSKYSEWSTVCIIKPINAPSFYLVDLDRENGASADILEEETNTLGYTTADFVGVYSYEESSEILNKWRLRLLDGKYEEGKDISSYVIIDSGWNFVGAYSYTEDSKKITFNCNLNYEFPDPEEGGLTSYKVYFEIETRNEYTAGILYDFNLSYSADKESIPKNSLQVAVNEEQGYIKVRYVTTDQTRKTSSWVLRRTSSTSNFQYWEDIRYFNMTLTEGEPFIFQYIDYTAQSGIIYKYGIQSVNIYGRRGVLEASQECMGEWEHAFLLEGFDKNARQLKMKYDFQISSYKTNVSESKTDTIGSRYPFVRRNGNMYYRSFPITGIITALMDDEELFTDNSQLYGTQKITVKTTKRQNQSNEDIYEEFFGPYDNYVNRYNYTHERKFRERVEAFLYNDNIKLYKSMQEGNILVKLMEVSLTPKQELGRLIYTFSATAYQIANVHQVYWHNNNLRNAATSINNLGAGVFSDSNVNIIQTLNDNGFFEIGTYDTELKTVGEWKIGQITCFGDYNPNTRQPIIIEDGLVDIKTAIINKYWGNITGQKEEIEIEDADKTDNIIISNMKIKNIHIEINNAPYLVSSSESVFNGSFYEKTQSNQLGTIIEFGENSPTKILVAPPHNIYNIMDDKEFNIRNLTFKIGDESHHFIGTVDFLYQLEYKVDVSKEVRKQTQKNVNGFLDYPQIVLDGNLANLIQMKYLQNYSTDTDNITQEVAGFKEVIIDSDPGTVIQVDGQTLYVNETGILHLDTLDSTKPIDSLVVKGVIKQGSAIQPIKPNILIYYFLTTSTKYRKKSDI